MITSFAQTKRFKLNQYTFILSNPEDFYSYTDNINSLLRKFIYLFSGTGRFEIELWIARILVSSIFENPSNLSTLFQSDFILPCEKNLREYLTGKNKKFDRTSWWTIEDIDKRKKIMLVNFCPR